MTSADTPIQPGDIVQCRDADGVWHEAIASHVHEDEAWVRFTTRGAEIPWPLRSVRKVSGPW